MKQTKKLFAVAIGLVVFSACQKEGRRDHDDRNDKGPGHVYTITNDAKFNVLIDFRRSENGMLTRDSSYATGGSGTGSGLGSQGAVIITDDEIILAVNAGSNSISSFKSTNHGLELKSTINSGGLMPISITQHNHIVFVLNAGGDGNISGFILGNDGRLSSIPNSTKPLSGSNVGPAQISFVNDGSALAITEKNSNKITTYTLNGTMHTLGSANPTPFGFAVGRNGNIFVSEAAGGAAGASTLSSYHIDNNGEISLVDGPIATNQSAACWVVITGNGKYAYTTNTGSNNISSFSINISTGGINLLKGISATTGNKPIDADFSNNSKFLYVLTSASNTINSFSVDENGSLHNLQTIEGLSTSSAGLAAK